MCVYYIMFSGIFSSKKSNDDDTCAEIKNLSEAINANIGTIESFLGNNGFITDVQTKLTEIQSQIKNFKKTQTAVTIVSNELKSADPDCTKALADLKTLQQSIGERDARIALLAQTLRDVRNAQNSNASQSEIIKKQNDCKQICTDILKDINGRLTILVGKFKNSQQTITQLLNSISTALLSTNGPATPDTISGVNPMNREREQDPDKNSFGMAPATDTGDVSNGGSVFHKNKRGGYYYPTSTSSKRNKKSVGRRKKHKRTNKTRR